MGVMKMESIETITDRSYIYQLEPWFKAAKRYIYTCPNRKELQYYGSGYNSWGVQTLQKALSAFAVASVHPDYNEKRAGMSKEELLEHAIKLLRFNLESHIEGDYFCTDGTKWGHTWISPLGIERMMHGVYAIYDYLSDKDRELMKKVFESECDCLISDNREIVAGLVKNNRPESNQWNGSFLLRTSIMFPDLPNVERYKEKAYKFLINAISVPSDETSTILKDGKPVKERFVGANFFESYALNHHGYMNVGYMLITLSNIAMLHFTYKRYGIKAPDSLYHHAQDLWNVVKKMTFPDGRLLRIGGDSRVRYCYCQDYALPTWLFFLDYLNDEDCIVFEKNWLRLVEKEAIYNNDGNYLSRRASGLEKRFPLYYTRLESDRAATLSMGAYWRHTFDLPTSTSKHTKDLMLNTNWYEEYQGSCLHRSSNRIASFTWISSPRVQGLCLPPDKSDMAEWWENLTGQIRTYGLKNYQEVLDHKEQIFDGGFLTYGKTQVVSDGFTEGQGQLITAINRLVYAALPDDKTVVGIQYATNCYHNYFESIKGLNLNMPNDLYNDNMRTYYYKEGYQCLRGPSGEERIWRIASNWLNVDNCLGVIKLYGDDKITLYSPGKRQIGLSSTVGSDLGFLHVDHICFPFIKDARGVPPEEVLYDIGYIIRSGDSAYETSNYAAKLIGGKVKSSCNVRAVMVPGEDGAVYLLVVNITDNLVNAEINVSKICKFKSTTSNTINETDNDGILCLNLEPLEARLLTIIP
jgi:hypothetical protein